MKGSDKPFTRIDLENTPSGILCKYWRTGWQEGDPSDRQEFIDGHLLSLCMQLEDKGYSITIFGENAARALCGEITRIDFFRQSDGSTIVRKYPHGWTASTRPLSEERKAPDFCLESALAWCRENGWSIRTWQDGARAWKGPLLPVRDKAEILRLRRRLNKQLAGPTFIDSVAFFYDLAFDL